MSVETHVHRAIDRVESEKTALAAKRGALEAFAERIETVDVGGKGATMKQQASGPLRTEAANHDRCSTVRTAFVETVTPHTGGDEEPVLESIRAELGEEIALALSPTTSTAFTRSVRQRVQTAVDNRQQEIAVTQRALARELESLESALETVQTVTDFFVRADETPLVELDFDMLAARHERLDAHARTCADLADQRQTVLDRTTSLGASVGVEHRGLVNYLYEDFPVTYPVLATVARVLDLIEGAKRVVRDHLVRRV